MNRSHPRADGRAAPAGVLRWRGFFAIFAVVALMAAACGDVDEPAATDPEPEPDPTQDAGTETEAETDDGADQTEEPGSEAAAEYPHDRLTFIVPFGPGGGADGTGRPFGENMAEALGVPVVFENIEGAGAAVGTAEMFRAEPDGATVGITTDFALVLQPQLNDDLPYAGWQDFDILMKMPSQPMIMVTRPGEFETFEEVLEAAGERPGEISIAAAGTWATSSVTARLLQDDQDVEFNIVPFTGGAAEGRTALLGDRVDLGISGVSSYLGLIESNDFHPLAVFWPERLELLPDVPSVAEFGVDVVGASDYYLVAPQGLPDDVRQLLLDAAQQAGEDEDYRQLMIDGGGVPLALPPEEAQAELTDVEGVVEKLLGQLDEQ